MQVAALSIGECVPPKRFDGDVHSVFDSAVNLRLAGENRLITLLISKQHDLPQGIRIWTKDQVFHTLVPGQVTALRDGVLRFAGSPLSVDLRGSPVWKCRLPELNLDMRLPAAQQAWLTAWHLLNQQQLLMNTDLVANDILRTGSGSSLSQRFSRPVMRLVAATQKLNVPHALFAAQKLIGLGPGLTPSGDDFLVGFLAGLWSTAAQRPFSTSFIRSFGGGLIKLAHKTGEISRTYLFHAYQGQFSSSLSRLVSAMATGDSLQAAVQAAMCVGHSSGPDSVTGLLIGLQAWNTKITKKTL